MSREKTDSTLSPYRVLDLADEKGLLCGKILADLGADVIKVEEPGGDAARNIGPFYKDIPHPEKSLYWFAFNLNKRSITLDIEKPDGAEIFKRLVKTADIVVESFQPGYLDSLGLGYAGLKEVNPQIILTSITPFGQTGPYAGYKGSDIVGWATGGMMHTCGSADRAPLQATAQQAYCNASAHAAAGTTVALYYREVSGEGQHVDVSVQESAMANTWFWAEVWDLMGMNMPRLGGVMAAPRANLPPLIMRLDWPCKDGRVSWGPTGGGWAGGRASSKALVEMANRDGMAMELKDYDWGTLDYSTVTQEEFDRVAGILAAFLATKTKADLFNESIEKGIILSPWSTTKDLLENAHLAYREFWEKVEHPELGEAITYPGAFIKLSEAPWRVWRRPPLIGEHNEEIYVEELGLSKEKVVLLKQAGVI